MMRILSYLRYQITVPFLFFTAGLTGVMLIVQSLHTIDLVVNQGLSIKVLAELTGLLIPGAVALIMPIALFCAVMFAYYRLWQDSELIVMGAVGLSPFKLLRPAAELATLVMIAVFALNLYVTPWGMRNFRAELNEARNDLAGILLKEGEFNDAVPGVTVYVRDRSQAGELAGLLIYDARKPQEPVTMTAEHGALVSTGTDGARILLLNGTRQESDLVTGRSTFLAFDRYVLDLASLSSDIGDRRLKPGERYLNELLPPYSTPQDEEDRERLLTEAHRRLSQPLYCLPLALLAAIGILAGEHNRRGRFSTLVIAALAAVVMRFAELGLGGLVLVDPRRAPVLYLWPLLVSVAGLVGLWASHHRKPSEAPPAPATEATP